MRHILILAIGIVAAVSERTSQDPILLGKDAIGIKNLPTVHGCPLSKDQYPFNVLPGSGWDNLVNQELGQVFEIEYKNCLSSYDGKFLIPDNTIITPIKKSMLQLNSDLFSHYANYSSLTSKSINVDASYTTPNYQISGSFSWEKKDIKQNQIKERSAISRVQSRYELYTVAVEPDSTLTKEFHNRILDIGAILKSKKDSMYPQYLADLLVRDFGTHVIRSVDAGAILSKTDILKSKYASKYTEDQTNITSAASLSWMKMLSVNVKGDYASNNAQLEEYNKNCANTKIETVGGGPYKSNFTIQDWEDSIDQNMVAVDRRGDPLFYAITPRSIPELDDKTVYVIGVLVKDAIHRYYSANTRIGCMNMGSKNFNDAANVDSGDCEKPESLYNFGGVYQVCRGTGAQCITQNQVNMATGAFTCPPNFDAIKLQTDLNKCEHICENKVFYSKCHYECSFFDLFWCAPNKNAQLAEGFLFGGIYSTTSPNPLTNSFSCPANYLAFQFGPTAKICLTTNEGEAVKDNLPFGGFYSCSMGNPLSENVTKETEGESKYWSRSCAKGYSSHMAVVSRGCQISYCVKSNALSGKEQPPLHRPPFIDLGFGPNVTLVTSFQSPLGQQFSMTTKGEWEPTFSFQSLQHNPIFLALSAVILLLALMVIGLLGCQILRRRQRKKHSGYQQL